jgi:hypothetical protein
MKLDEWRGLLAKAERVGASGNPGMDPVEYKSQLRAEALWQLRCLVDNLAVAAQTVSHSELIALAEELALSQGVGGFPQKPGEGGDGGGDGR